MAETPEGPDPAAPVSEASIDAVQSGSPSEATHDLPRDHFSETDAAQVFYNVSNLPIADQVDWEKRMIYRLFLRSPYPPATWLLDTWHVIHLGLVNEMSLFPQTALPKGVEFRCYASILSVSHPDTQVQVDVEVKGLDATERGWSSNESLHWPGMSGGRGAMSIRLSAPPSDTEIPDSFLLKIGASRGPIEDALFVLPLIVGPFQVTRNKNFQLTGEEMLYFHRQLTLPLTSPPQDETGEAGRVSSIMIRESPELAIPGKIWDSALFASPSALSLLTRHPSSSDPSSSTTQSQSNDLMRVLDLSSGTGVCGIWIAAALCQVNRKSSVTITDLPESISTMSFNVSLNRHLLDPRLTSINVASLNWSQPSDCEGFVGLDVVVACDLIYEAEMLPDLVNTLDLLTTPGKTKVVVGYKQRGLTKLEKSDLWKRFEDRFVVQRMDGVNGVMERECSSSFIGIELWMLWKPLH